MEKLHGVVLPLVLDLLDTRKIHFTRFFSNDSRIIQYKYGT